MYILYVWTVLLLIMIIIGSFLRFHAPGSTLIEMTQDRAKNSVQSTPTAILRKYSQAVGVKHLSHILIQFNTNGWGGIILF